VPTFTPPTFLVNRKKPIALIATALLLVGVTANAAGTAKDYHRYHVICVDLKTKKITYGGDAGSAGCNSPSFTVVSTSGLAAASIKGLDGLNGLNGKDGRDGKDGKTLWNGVNDPEVSWGTPGDMFINATTKTLFGPKNLDGTWPAGVSMVGPKGDRGPIGLTGATGPQGPGGSGPAGPTGATGPAGAAGTNGTNGTNGANGTNGTNGSGGSSVGFISPDVSQAIVLNNADTQWSSFIEVASTENIGNGSYIFTATVSLNNSQTQNDPSIALCFVYGGSTGVANLVGYATGTMTLTMNGAITISGLSNNFIKMKCGKSTGDTDIYAQYPRITAIKVETLTQTVPAG
jgi:uncharacterized membrane protein YtjA (UPF0391 family)